jgi:hypothetical protein
MYYALVHYPHIDTDSINGFRRKYDPHFDLIQPHITFIFPVQETIGEQRLVDHVEKVLSKWEPYAIHLNGFCKSWDHWLFLILQQGNDQAIRLHDELYTGILTEYCREDIEFIPHLGLGQFTQLYANYDPLNPQQVEFDSERYEQALAEAEQLRFDYHCIVDRLTLVKITDDISRIVWDKEYSLTP